MDAAESYAKPAEIGDVMPGAGVAEVIASGRHPGYAQGEPAPHLLAGEPTRR